MSANLITTQDIVSADINQLTNDTIKQLTEMWSATYEADTCKENLKMLTDHVKTFYSDIIEETSIKKYTIETKIKKLHEEASNLKRLLNVNINISPKKNVPLHTARQQIDESLENLRDELRQRKIEIDKLLVEQEHLCSELGEELRELLDDPLPTAEDLSDFRNYLDSLQCEKDNRFVEINTIRDNIKCILGKLELSLTCDAEIDLINNFDITLNRENLFQLRDLHKSLEKQYNQLKEKVNVMREKLEILWDFLEVSPSKKNKVQKYTDYTQTTFDKYFQEIERCESEKRQNIKLFIDKVRAEIINWWEKTAKSDTEKSRFTNFTSDCYTEELLILHEMELDDLKQYYSENGKIFDLITERKILWSRMIALEAKESEPGRYNNRGGQLLKEEKERKMISNKLPKIEGQLRQLVSNYQETHNRPFKIYGQNIIESIESDWNERQNEKEKLNSARKKNQLTPTPNKFKTPMSARANSTKFGSMTNLGSLSTTKRKLPMGFSTNMSSMPATKQRNLPVPTFKSTKRCLLGELPDTNTFLTPKISKNMKKTPTKRIYDTTRRKSNRLSGASSITKKKHRISKPKILINGKEERTHSDSVSYDVFEEFIESHPPCRSSVVIKRVPQSRRNVGTPKLLKIPCDQKSLYRSPGGSDKTISASGMSRKLKTKNLPIII